ncbi:MAG: hypothetical protein UT24_C0019G0015 [Candidatus Woesebacteria bacterium GW2011_GWB1_39_12]|uniref:Uncharacterized protein n=1 Tax=Candidatus Woesebacteria bacterium GW2011_GWB1_39_12 TaxID=1618574 RepID=A0A0G0MHW7_9BACT|nr:MAG: hypothetical protein UT24_C0019G0015 [Candidatus Woesebacteria bacterium GW2011_GWB1_39_12]
MKKIIPIHSIIDITTNSSSELFICNTQKTEEEVKEFLEALGQAVGQWHGMGEIRSGNGVGDLLKEIHSIHIVYWDNGSLGSLIGQFVHWDADPKLKSPAPFWQYEDLEPPIKSMRTDWRDMPIEEKRKQWDEEARQRDELEDAKWIEIDQWFEENREVLEQHVGHFICAESEDDNSVPYDLFNVIETRLHGIRLHLG